MVPPKLYYGNIVHTDSFVIVKLKTKINLLFSFIFQMLV
jgi:hypothetical protein